MMMMMMMGMPLCWVRVASVLFDAHFLCRKEERVPFELLLLLLLLLVLHTGTRIWWWWCYNRLSSNKSLFHSKTHLPKA